MLIELTPQEKETLRIALFHFIEDLREDGLGDDEHGRLMVTIYLMHSESILQKIASSEVKVNPRDGKPWPEYDPRLRHHRDGFRTPPSKE